MVNEGSSPFPRETPGGCSFHGRDVLHWLVQKKAYGEGSCQPPLEINVTVAVELSAPRQGMMFCRALHTD